VCYRGGASGARLDRNWGRLGWRTNSYTQMTAGGQSFFIWVARDLAPAAQAPASTPPTPGIAPSVEAHTAAAANVQTSIAVVQIVRLTELSCGVHGSGGLSPGWPPHSPRHPGKQSRTRGAHGAMQSCQHSTQALEVRSMAQGPSCAGRNPGRTDATLVIN
jgi:hypothetical protein